MAIGSEVGFVLDLGDGSLRRVKGFLVELDSTTATVAVAPGIAPEGSVPLEVILASGSTCQVSFVRVDASEVTTDTSGWTKASGLPEGQVTGNLLRALYKEELDIKRVETDSMVSAQSVAQVAHRGDVGVSSMQKSKVPLSNSLARSSGERSAGFQQVTFADSEDEDFATELMQRFANARGQTWGATDADDEMPWSTGGADQTYQRVVDRMTGAGSGRTGERTSEENAKKGGSDQVIMMALMELLKKQRSQTEEQPGGKAVRRLQKLRSRVETEPEAIVGQYLQDIMDKLGTEPGDSFQPWMWTSRINWGKLAGLHRVHFHLSHILGLSLKGKKKQAEAYTVQLLRSLHQVSLDNGMWSTASLLLPRPDPIYRENFGATETELEAVVGYQEALKKIRNKTAAEEPTDDKDAKAKGGAKGGRPD